MPAFWFDILDGLPEIIVKDGHIDLVRALALLGSCSGSCSGSSSAARVFERRPSGTAPASA